jgi:hypothetical protein
MLCIKYIRKKLYLRKENEAAESCTIDGESPVIDRDYLLYLFIYLFKEE